MEVVVVRWPDEEIRLERLRDARMPRLLLVATETVPPACVDPLEDWVRLPVDDRDVAARVATLMQRAAIQHVEPELDGDGLLRYGSRWAALSPVERLLAGALVERFGSVVTRDGLAQCAWPAGAPTRNALDVHMLRLRRRIEPLGLEVRTVRSRGYLLQDADA